MNTSHCLPRPLTALVAAALGAALAPAGGAQILTTSGDCVVPRRLPPALVNDAYQSDTRIAVFREVQNRRLPADLTVQLSAEGTYPPGTFNPSVIPAGTRVNSYLFHVDPVSDTGTLFAGDVLLHEEVLGVIYADGGLDASDPLVGHPAVTYPTGFAWRGAELDISDVITWSGATIKLSSEVTGALDQIRVITRAPDLCFSLDIGSDSEYSDPLPTGNEFFDPGSVYVADAFDPLRPALQWDDEAIFPLVNFPEAPIPAPYGCTGTPEDCYREVFDLDGYDLVSVRLGEYLPGPIFRSELSPFEQRGIHPPQRLVISYDDDPAAGWVGGATALPTFGFSPTGAIYGTSPGADELLTVRLAGAVPPLPLLGTVPREDEEQVHPGLVPNPPLTFTQLYDDDVDALDAVPAVGPSRPPLRRKVHLFSADHEGNSGFFQPGAIYTVGPAGPAPVIHPVQHLGISPYADIDAFELTWLLIDPPSTWALALVFSIDDDDPLTAVDESGGLDPASLYASYLDGSSFRLTARFKDDIDALAIMDPRSEDLSQDRH